MPYLKHFWGAYLKYFNIWCHYIQTLKLFLSISKLNSSGSIPLWHILNMTWSYWSYQKIGKGCFNVAVYTVTFWISNGHQFSFILLSKDAKNVLGIRFRIQHIIFSQWFCDTSNLHMCTLLNFVSRYIAFLSLNRVQVFYLKETYFENSKSHRK